MKNAKFTFLITAGPTVEDIDPVRFISNRATGKLGFAVARAALSCGHSVKLVHGPVADELVRGLEKSRGASKKLERVAVRSCSQMHRATMTAARSADVVVMTAAVADWTPASFSKTKLKKGGMQPVLKLKPTVDILKALGHYKSEKRSDLVLVGFALETGSGRPGERLASRIAEARRKLASKNLDAIVLDTPSEMGSDRGVFRVLHPEVARPELLRVSKEQMARRLVELGFDLCAARAS